MAAVRTQTIYDGSGVPIRGLASRKPAQSIIPGQGYFKQIQNLRWGDTGLLQVRSGISAISGAIAAGKLTWGAGILNLNGAGQTIWGATKDTGPNPNLTSVNMSSNGTAYTLQTPTVGKYGDTRFQSDPATGKDVPIVFQAVHDRLTGTDVVVGQNGTDYPRVFGANGNTCAVHRPISPPSLSVSSAFALLIWEGGLDSVLDPASGAVTAFTGVNWTYAIAAFSLKAGFTATTVPTGDGTVAFSASQDWSHSAKMSMVLYGPAATQAWFLRNFAITAVATGNHKCYDPTLPAYSQFATSNMSGVDGSGNTETAYQFSIVDLAASGHAAAVTGFIVSAVGSEPAPATATLIIEIVAGSGQVLGGCSYEASYFNSGSLAESYSQVLITSVENFALQNGKRTSPIPDSPAMYYKARIFYLNTSNAERDFGTDSLRLYRSAYQETDATYCQTFQIATWGGPWAFVAGTELAQEAFTDNTPDESRLMWLLSPGAFQIPIPIGRAMITAQARLIVGAKADPTITPGVYGYPRVAVSRADVPFRFTNAGVDTSDPLSADEELLTGENVWRFVQSAASTLGASTVYMFTDGGVWVLNLNLMGSKWFLDRLSSVGTNSPLTVTEHEGVVYFVDADMRARMLSGYGFIPISLGWVDDKLLGIPVTRRQAVTGCWYDFRYRIGYTPLGGTQNTRELLYSENAKAWESDDLMPGAVTLPTLLLWRPGVASITGAPGIVGDARLIAIGDDTLTYWLENGTTIDLATGGVAVVIGTGAFHRGMWGSTGSTKGLTLLRTGIIADTQVGLGLNVTRTYRPSGLSAPLTTLNLQTGASPWRFSFDTALPSGNGNGVAAELTFAGSMHGLSSIYALVAELDDRDINPELSH